ncbi:MAG TPA: porin family protein [Edaphocola sp.]|nr:porin family protein [Edaphocola sp.]
MKKTIIGLLMGMAIASGSNAQSNRKHLVQKNTATTESVALGIKGGFTIPNIDGGYKNDVWNKDYKSTFGPHFGLFAQIRLNNHWALVPELNYAGQGVKRTTIQPLSVPYRLRELFHSTFQTDKNYAFANVSNELKVNYLQLPIHLQYQTPISRNQKLVAHVQFGPYIGLMLSGNQRVYSEDLHLYLDEKGSLEIPPALVHQYYGSSIDTNMFAKDDLYRMSYGISGALGLSYQVGRSKLWLELASNYSLRYIDKDGAQGKKRIGAAMVLLGYSLPLDFGRK